MTWREAFRPERIRELFEQAPGFMATLRGPDHVYEAVNPAYCAFMGMRELIGRPLREAAPELVAQGLLDICDEVYRTGHPYVCRELRVELQRNLDEAPVETWVRFVLQPLRAADGSVHGIFCQGHELSDLKLANDQLRASREELAAALSATEAIFDHSHDVICAADANGFYTRVSRCAEQVWGYRPEQIVGRHFTDFIHPDDVADSLAASEQVRSGRPTNMFMNRIVHRDGTPIPVMWSSAWSEAQQAFFAIGRDIRGQAEAQERLRQAQKMEAVGRLTGGVAHDFNNLLTTVIGNTEALEEGLRDRPELQALAQLVLEAAEQGADLVGRLLAVSRRQPLAPAPVDCGVLLVDLARMLRRTIGEDVQIVVELGEGKLRCMADPSQLTAALLNLALNARDAMPAGGQLTLSARQELERGSPAWTVLSVEDTGEGMSQEVVERAFEPFFTTKPPVRGSGLGLSMVYGFATQSGGRIDIESAPGRGTRMRLALPYTSQSPVRPLGREGAGRCRAPAHILVVEDDALVRDQVRRQLLALGYGVTTTSDGREALEWLAADGAADLLFTDVVMPGGMNGRQLADQARLLRPGLRVLFTSGYTEDAIIRAGGIDAEFLPKPYRRAQLARKVAVALDNA